MMENWGYIGFYREIDWGYRDFLRSFMGRGYVAREAWGSVFSRKVLGMGFEGVGPWSFGSCEILGPRRFTNSALLS